jgi:hypothetical protein
MKLLCCGMDLYVAQKPLVILAIFEMIRFNNESLFSAPGKVTRWVKGAAQIEFAERVIVWFMTVLLFLGFGSNRCVPFDV